ncbi:MAG: lactonase family protein [Isosphaeraceae bacterium]
MVARIENDRPGRFPVVKAGLFILGLGVATLAQARAGVNEMAPAERSSGPLWLYVGTYTGGKAVSEGIYLLELDPQSGRVTNKGAVAKLTNPSFLAIHPGGKFVYAVNEVGDFQGKGTGAVSALAIDPSSGKLTLLNQQSSVGNGPCHLTVDRIGKNVLVANYGSGSVACLPIGSDGTLSPASSFIQHEGAGADPGRQQGPHAHSINLDRANRFAFAADLGLDKVLIYRFDADKGTLTPNEPPFAKVAPASGPRHFAFRPDGKFAYVINEMANTVTAFAYDAEKGSLDSIQAISTLPDDFKGTSYTAEVQVHPSGKFVYGSNRGHDSIAIFRVDPETGKLTAAGHQSTLGKNPRNFALDPSGSFLLAENQDSDTIAVFRIDSSTGGLTQVGEPISVPMPVCIRMMPKPE